MEDPETIYPLAIARFRCDIHICTFHARIGVTIAAQQLPMEINNG
jgi:hypothetical protein